MLAFLCFIFGACLGSFIPCFAERRAKGRSQWGRSHCTHCGTVISPLGLVPIFGYFISGGRCQHCGAPIPYILPLLEIFSSMIGLIIGLQTSHPLHALLLLSAYAMLLLLSLDDGFTHYIRDCDLCFLALFFLLDIFLFAPDFWLNRLLGALIVSLPLFIITLFAPQELGSGDIFFMAICGFYLALPAITYAFGIGIAAALLYGLILIVMKKATRKTAIPLIPFLSFGVLTTILVLLL